MLFEKKKIRSLPFHYRPVWKRNAQHDDCRGHSILGSSEVETNGRISTARGMNRGSKPSQKHKQAPDPRGSDRWAGWQEHHDLAFSAMVTMM